MDKLEEKQNSKPKGNTTYDQFLFNMLLECSRKRDITEWNKWREENGEIEINLKKAPLENMHLEEANLKGAKLQRAHLNNTNLMYANLRGADLEKAYLKEAILEEALLEKAILHEANLQGANLHEAHLEGAHIHHANLNNANLRKIWFDGDTKSEETMFGDAVLSIHPSCKISEAELIELFSKAEVTNIRFINPVFGRTMRDEAWLFHFKKICMEKWCNRFWFKLWGITSDYGRNLYKWIRWSFGIAVFFGFLFLFIGPEQFRPQQPEAYTWFSFFYYSFVTFTTLGFGDIIPTTWFTEVLVTVEVLIGYIMLGGLISIFANKLARRND